MITVHRQAQPFFLKGDSQAALLFIHGFTASPSELRPVTELLREYCACTVSALLLPGHGSEAEDLNRFSWQDWFAAVKVELLSLQEQYPQVFVAGLSLGGFLALYSGLHVPGVNGVLSINAPVFLRSGFKTALLPFIARFRPYWPKKEMEAQRRLAEEGRFAYDCIPLRAFQSVMELRNRLLRDLGDLRVPALIMQSQNDELVKPESGGYLFGALRRSEVMLVELENSRHIATMGPEKERIARELADFIMKRKSGAGL